MNILFFFNLWHPFISEKIICVYVYVFNPTGESTSIYISKNVLAFHDQNILLGTTYRIIAEALIREPTCLAEIEESKARRILDLSGSSTENAEKVMNTVRVNFLCLCVLRLQCAAFWLHKRNNEKWLLCVLRMYLTVMQPGFLCGKLTYSIVSCLFEWYRLFQY